MINVNIKEGLGNQMFQYATAYAIAKKNKTSVICDVRSLEENYLNPPDNYIKREYSLDIFNIYPNKLNLFDMIITLQLSKKYTRRFFLSKILNIFSPFTLIEMSRKTDNRLLTSKKKILYLDGYWQSQNYFKEFRDDIIKIFNFNELIHKQMNIDLLKKVNFKNDVCLNVRRTDHLNLKEFNVITEKYYDNSINFYLKNNTNTKFFVFSDDIEWCKKKFFDKDKFTIIDHNYSGVKFKNYLYLMSNFKNFIIPNSTFAWWGAWLSKQNNKNVLVPRRWSGNLNEKELDIIVDDWIKVEN